MRFGKFGCQPARLGLTTLSVAFRLRRAQFGGIPHLPVKLLTQNHGDPVSRLSLAFPQHNNAPACSFESGDVSSVADDSRLEFVLPEHGVGAGSGREPTPPMSMPEAPMDKNYSATLR